MARRGGFALAFALRVALAFLERSFGRVGSFPSVPKSCRQYDSGVSMTPWQRSQRGSGLLPEFFARRLNNRPHSPATSMADPTAQPLKTRSHRPASARPSPRTLPSRRRRRGSGSETSVPTTATTAKKTLTSAPPIRKSPRPPARVASDRREWRRRKPRRGLERRKRR